MRATPPSRRMSAGTRSSAITAQAPASSAILACSAVVTSMITPPLSISARPDFTVKVPVSSSESWEQPLSAIRIPGAIDEPKYRTTGGGPERLESEDALQSAAQVAASAR